MICASDIQNKLACAGKITNASFILNEVSCNMFEDQNYLMMQAADSAILRTGMLLYLSCGIKLLSMYEHLPRACVHASVIRLLSE